MGRMKNKIKNIWRMSAYMAAICISLTGCGSGEEDVDLSTPEEAAESTMEAIKTVDMNAFNASTDNYLRSHKNWLGITIDEEYRVFNELQQAGHVKKKKREANLKFARKMAEELSWEIVDIREQPDTAEIDMEITNRDMRDVVGYYMIHAMEDMIESEGTGIRSLIRNLSEWDYDKTGILPYMDDAKDICTIDVTVDAYKEGEKWKVHLDDAFISAFMGNFDAGEFSEEVETRLDELEDEYEVKMEQWGDVLGDKIEDWTVRIFE